MFKKLGMMMLCMFLCMNAISLPQKVSAANIDDYLAAYFSFNEDINSSLGTLQSSINGSGVSRVDERGIEGGALYFSKEASSNFTISQAINANGSYSLAAWVQYDADLTSDKVSLYQQNGSGRTLLYFTSGSQYGTYVGASDVMFGGIINRNAYHHVALTYDAPNKKMSVYIDGKLSAENTISGTPYNGVTDLLIGAHKNGAVNNAMKGYVDELRLYNQAIDATTVAAIYQLHAFDEVKAQLYETIQEAKAIEPCEDEEWQETLLNTITLAENLYNNNEATSEEIVSMKNQLIYVMKEIRARASTITISINSEDEVRTIGDEMFGINHRYHNDGYGTYDPESDQIYEEFEAYVKEADFGSIRYPGGAVANLFHWKRAIGPMEERKNTIHGLPDSNAPVVPNFGVDEAMNWIYDDLDSEAIWVYGFGTGGGSSDLADLYEYLNAPNDGSNVNGGTDWAKVRAENGHEEPYGVQYFEIGNEIGYYAQTYWMDGRPAGMSTTEAYIEGGLMTFDKNTKTVQEEDWRTSAATSNGAANQVRYIKYAPAVAGSMEVYVGGTKWNVVDSLENAGKENVCMIDEETGKITFGDGTHGNIPANGAVITCAYQSNQDGFVDYSRALKDIANQLNQEVYVYSCVYENTFTSLMAQKGYNDDYDGIVIHPYSDNGIDENDPQFYEKILGRSLQYNMPRVEALINRMEKNAPGQDKVPVLSEFGIYKYNSKFIRSLGHAIYIGNEMIDYINYGTPYINKHCLSDYPYQSDSLGTGSQCVIQTIIDTDGTHCFVMTPSAKLYTIMNQMSGSIQIRETIENNPVYYTYEGYDVKTIKTLATKDEEGNFYFIVVNNSKDDPTHIKVQLDDINMNGKMIEKMYMTSEQVDDENTLENPDLVDVKKVQFNCTSDELDVTLEPHSITAFKIENVIDTENSADKTELRSEIKKVQKIDTKNYSDESVEALNEALAQAQEISITKGVTQKEVDACLEALREAVENLVWDGPLPLKAENLINKAANDGVSVIASSSNYTGESADKTLDYQNNTHWHSNWAGNDVLPQSITYDLGQVYELGDITFLPRQDGGMNGDILEMEVYAGESEASLTKVGTYTFEGEGLSGLSYRGEFQRINFEQAVSARYVKVVATKSAADSTSGQNKWASMSEIRFYQAEKVNKDALQALLNEVNTFNKDAYETSSWNDFETTKQAAEIVLASTTTQEAVDEAVTSLQQAIDQLLLVPAKVENLKVKQVDYKTVQCTWDKVKNATSYRVYRRIAEGEFKLIKTLTATSLEVTSLYTGREYQFKVCAINKNEKVSVAGKASAIVSAKTTLEGKPTLSIKKISHTKFTLSWTKVEGATRYIIYRKRGNDQLKKLLTLGGNDFSYSTKELPQGNYQFVLKAGRYDSKDRVMTAASNRVSGTSEYEKIAVKLTAGTKQIKVSWNKVEGIQYYQVYRSTSEKGTYKLLKTTTSTSFTSKSLTSGKRYYFKVRGYKSYNNGKETKKIYSSYSDVKSIKAK